MDTTKFMTLEKLKRYDAALKAKMAADDAQVLADAKSHSDANLATAKTYTDEAVAQKSQVQFIVWEEND
jgi:hypothetical protein